MAAYRDGKQWRWRKQVKLPGMRARRLSGTPAVNTRLAAEEDEANAVVAFREGRYVEPEAPTLQAVRDDYLASVKLRRSPGLYSNRVKHLEHLMETFGRTRLDRIEPRAMERFAKAKLDDGYEPGSVNQFLVALSNVFRWAKENGLAKELAPVKLLERPDASLTDVEHLEQNQLDELVSRTSGMLQRMIVVAAYTGVRAGELISLQWPDVDFAKGRITVRRNFYKGHDRPPKGKRARNIPLCATARSALLAQRHDIAPQVFCHEDGERLNYDHIRRLGEAADTPGWHALRHTFGTLLSTRGVPLKAIQEWMGHADIKTTMVYARYSPVLDEAISVLDHRAVWQTGANPKGDTPDSGETPSA